MQKYRLAAETRSLIGKKVKGLREKGAIPAVLYGGKGYVGSQPLAVSEKAFWEVYRNVGESSIFTLKIGPQDMREVLVHDIAHDPLSGKVLHIDFFEVRMDKKLRAIVPVVLKGESVAVKGEGGILVHILQEVEVECFPKDLPHELAVDISVLQKFHEAIRVKDLALPNGVSLTGVDPESAVALVEEPRSESELASLGETPEENVAAVEVAGKKPEEGESAKEEGGTPKNEKSPSPA